MGNSLSKKKEYHSPFTHLASSSRLFATFQFEEDLYVRLQRLRNHIATSVGMLMMFPPFKKSFAIVKVLKQCIPSEAGVNMFMGLAARHLQVPFTFIIKDLVQSRTNSVLLELAIAQQDSQAFAQFYKELHELNDNSEISLIDVNEHYSLMHLLVFSNDEVTHMHGHSGRSDLDISDFVKEIILSRAHVKMLDPELKLMVNTNLHTTQFAIQNETNQFYTHYIPHQ